MLSPDLAEHPAVVLTAYVAVFVPWTAVDSRDVISAEWRTVRSSRQDATFQLCFVVIPTFYIVFYIYLQALAGDYKELSAAIVGLIFSLLHLLRTVWGLWQLYEFRIWAENAIRGLQLMGFDYHLLGADEDCYSGGDRDPKRVADHILVNETVVDNQLYHGVAQCFLRYGSRDLRPSTSRKYSKRFLRRLAARSRLFLSVCLLPAQWCVEHAISLICRRDPPPRLRQVPREPVELWLNWASVFAAQGLRDWLKDFQPVEDPDSKQEGENRDKRALYDERRDYFAKEVLASAALHLGPASCGEECASSPMLWPEWDPDSDICDGRVTKKELFRLSVQSGEGLPFSAPQLELFRSVDPSAEENERRSDIESAVGYRPFAKKLRRVTESLPASFGEETARFDDEKLEWLTILLFLGTRAMAHCDSQEDVVWRNAAKSSKGFCSAFIRGRNRAGSMDKTELDSEASTCIEGDKHGNGGNDSNAGTEGLLAEDGLGIENLKTQLGFSRSAADAKRYAAGVEVLNAFSMNREVWTSVSASNRLVLKASELIDLWLSLVSGEQVGFVLSKDGTCEDLCRVDASAIPVLEWKLDGGIVTENSSRPSPGRTNDELRRKQFELEIARLEFQFAKTRQRYWNLDQTLTFMGCGMEYVRTELASWRRRNPDSKAIVWQPKIPFAAENQCACRTFRIGSLSVPFARELCSGKIVTHLENRSVQVRLLWEIQVLLQKKLSQEGANPSSLAVMVLCVMAFPSLVVKTTETPINDVVPIENARGSCILQLCLPSNISNTDSNTSKAPARYYVISIEPQCGPQKLLIWAELHLNSRSEVFVDISLARKSNSADDCFMWEWWRDSFSARLDGLMRWQKLHKMPLSEIYCTEGPISGAVRSIPVREKGMGDALYCWSGWMPFRVDVCRFELQSPGFVTQFIAAKDVFYSYRSFVDGNVWYTKLAKQRRVPVDYKSARLDRLQYACFVVREVLRGLHDGAKEQKDQSRRLSTTEQEGAIMVRDANALISLGGHENIDRALHLLEIAAVELGNVDGLTRFAEILVSHEYVANDVKRICAVVRRSTAALLEAIAERRLVSITDGLGRTVLGVHSVYEDWSRRHLHEPEVVTEFSRWVVVMVSAGMDLNLAAAAVHLRRAFMYSRDLDNIFKLGMLTPGTRRTASSPGVVIGRGVRQETGTESALVASAGETGTRKNAALWLALLERAAVENDNAWSMYYLGLEFHQGRDFGHNLKRAVEYFEGAIDKGNHVLAMHKLGTILCEGGDSVEKDLKRAVRLFERAIEEGGNVESMVSLAEVLSGRAGGELNLQRAVGLYERAIAEYGNVQAIRGLSEILMTGGEGVERDVDRAQALLSRIKDFSD